MIKLNIKQFVKNRTMQSSIIFTLDCAFNDTNFKRGNYGILIDDSPSIMSRSAPEYNIYENILYIQGSYTDADNYDLSAHVRSFIGINTSRCICNRSIHYEM